MFVWNASLSGTTKSIKKNHDRVKEDVFQRQLEGVFNSLEQILYSVKTKKDESLNTAKIKKIIVSKLSKRQEEIELTISHFFEVR